MNKTLAKKYLTAIRQVNKKVVSSELLSRHMGIYPEIINEQLSTFEPMLAMDTSFNLKDLIPVIEKYIAEQESKKEKVVRFETKKVSKKYKSVSDFVYKRLTIGGLVNKNAILSIEDLKVLRKLVNDEIDAKKK